VAFILRMAWRETRASWARLLLFFLCAGLGVAAIVALRSVTQQVRATLTAEARSLLAADVLVEARRPFADVVLPRAGGLLASPAVQATTRVIETQTMAAPVPGEGNGHVKLVEVRGIEAPFPFYGRLELERGTPYSHALVAGHGAIVQRELLFALGLDAGDSIRIGGQAFEVRGVIARDRFQQGGGIAFGPRVYVDLADLEATALLGFGSRVTYRLLLRTAPEATNDLTRDLRAALRDEAVSVRSWRALEDRIGRNLSTAENYLSLVGFAIVVLGGIGVWSVTRVLIQQKIRSIAVLKCLGASSTRVLAIYVLVVLALAAGGSVLGVALAAAALAAVPAGLLTALGITAVPVTLSAAAQGTAVGLLVSLLFALVPLLEVRQVKPLRLLRADTTATARRHDWRSRLVSVTVMSGLWLVASWQADSVRVGGFVSGGLLVVALALALLSHGIVRLVHPLTRSTRFAVRHAIISLARPGNQTRVILMTVGLGCFFILTVRVIQANLLHAFSTEVGQDSPDLVLIDIQPDQVDSVQAAVAAFVRQPARIVPLMRGRITGIDGRRVQLQSLEDVRRHGGIGREFGLTFRNALAPNERVLAGAFWSGPVSDALPAGVDTDVSIEQDIRDDARVGVGDVIRFDVAGQPLRARVTSVRAVDWEQSQNGGFVFVLRPAPAVERAAHNYVGFLQVAEDPRARATLQRDLVASHPNISVIDVRDVLAAIADVVNNVTLGVTVVGAVTLVGGALILIGAVAMTRFQRLYEASIYRTLGASTRVLATMVLVEYGVLGLLASLAGAAGALALSWALARYLFSIAWSPAPAVVVIGVMATTVAVSLVGLAASLDVLVRKPLGALRSE
jgi:putative ABC transport system permease protein